MWNEALAQAPGAPGGNDAFIGMLLSYLPIVLIFAIMYFLIFRPQQERQRQLRDMLGKVKKGDRVLTSGGIYGTVLGVDEGTAMLRIADDTKVEFAKSAIVQVLTEEKKS